MKPLSLGYRTDLLFHRFEGELTEREHYLVVRTPSDPTYRWGNFLLFASPPRAGDLGRWEGLFAHEIGVPPTTMHKVFGWEGGSDETGIAPFLASGYRLRQNLIMTASTLKRPEPYYAGLEIRQLEGDADFAEHLGLHVLCRDDNEDEVGYRTFFQASVRSYRRMIAAGLGVWFGGFVDGKLVADMGIFSDGTLCRFQAVVTHPAWRRRGVCRTLLYEVGRFGLEQLGAKTLVIAADEEYFAKDLYAAAGFRVEEKQVGLEWSNSSRSI